MAPITDKREIRRLWFVAKRYALLRHSDVQFAEDFAQEYVLDVTQGKRDKLSWRYADFFKKCLGRNGKKCVLYDESFHDLVDPIGTKRLEILEMRNFIDSIENKQQRNVLKLFLHGVSIRLQAEIFDLDQSRISQIYKEALKTLRMQYKDKE